MTAGTALGTPIKEPVTVTIVALACPGTADDAPSPLHARLAAAGVNVVHAPMPVPAVYVGNVDLLALDIGTPLADPELGRQVARLLDARDRMLASQA